MEKIKVYTPLQIGLGSLLGGPIAFTYFIRKNFLSLEKKGDAKQSTIWGSITVLAAILAVPFIPESFPNTAIPVIFCVMGNHIATQKQLTKKKIEESSEYAFISNWKVFGLSVLLSIVFVVIAALYLLIIQSFGVINLE